MRVPVVDRRGVPLMPCTPAKARHLLKQGKACARRSKLGRFYLQLKYEQEPDHQSLVVGIDPGSRFEGFSVVGTRETVLNAMSEAPPPVKHAADASGAMAPTCWSLWYLVPARRHRRQLHAFQPAKGGARRPYGGTRSQGLKRGTLVQHPRYGLCAIGGEERKGGGVSLHAYRSNRRIARGFRGAAALRKTWVAFRTWYIRRKEERCSAAR